MASQLGYPEIVARSGWRCMCLVATGHAKFLTSELTATKRVKDRVDFPAEMRTDFHAFVLQGAQQRFGDTAAEQKVQFERREGAGKCFRRLRFKHDLLSARFLAIATF